jgi:hypothetical protein
MAIIKPALGTKHEGPKDKRVPLPRNWSMRSDACSKCRTSNCRPNHTNHRESWHFSGAECSSRCSLAC